MFLLDTEAFQKQKTYYPDHVTKKNMFSRGPSSQFHILLGVTHVDFTL